MKRSAGKVNEVPACGTFVHHALLDVVDSAPGRWIGSGKANILATICKASEAFIGDAGTLVKSIGTGMTEAAVDHIPAMQTRASSKGRIPDKWIEATDCPVVIDQRKKLLSQLHFF